MYDPKLIAKKLLAQLGNGAATRTVAAEMLLEYERRERAVSGALKEALRILEAREETK